MRSRIITTVVGIGLLLVVVFGITMWVGQRVEQPIQGFSSRLESSSQGVASGAPGKARGPDSTAQPGVQHSSGASKSRERPVDSAAAIKRIIATMRRAFAMVAP